MELNTWYKHYNQYRLYFFAELTPDEFMGIELDSGGGSYVVDVWNYKDISDLEEANLTMEDLFIREAKAATIKEVFTNKYYERDI